MVPHALADSLFSNPDGSLNGLGTFLVWGFFIACGLAFLCGIPAAIAKHRDDRKSGLPPEPSNLSPAVASLLSGRNVAAYTAPVRAVTPARIAVRQSRCCPRGHQSPAQAVRHAEAIKQRMETTGR